MIVKKIKDITFIDSIQLFDEMKKSAKEDKLKAMMKLSGVEFFDKEGTYIKRANVGIVGLGGMAIKNTSDAENISLHLPKSNVTLSVADMGSAFTSLNAASGFMSYLNVGNLDAKEIIDKMFSFGHFSTLHTAYLNIGIFGISSLVENEFNCQRDILHLSRITEARTPVQSLPPLVVLYPEFLPLFKDTYEYAIKKREEANAISLQSKKDFLETANQLFPSSKATSLIISGTFKNWKKLVDTMDDSGKEEEYKRVIYQINTILNGLWPTIFKPNNAYAYRLPDHLL